MVVKFCFTYRILWQRDQQQVVNAARSRVHIALFLVKCFDNFSPNMCVLIQVLNYEKIEGHTVFGGQWATKIN